METTLSFTNEIPLFMRLGKIAAYSNLTKQQQQQYDDSYHNYMCYHGQLDYKYKKGKEEGREEAKISIARYLKSMGTMTLEQIAEATQLSIAEISKL